VLHGVEGIILSRGMQIAKSSKGGAYFYNGIAHCMPSTVHVYTHISLGMYYTSTIYCKWIYQTPQMVLTWLAKLLTFRTGKVKLL